ncbi:MAG: M1 family metallopeptidase [Methanocorpusculum sp.]|nr:M1 family metallopeptidase [Methanocorpusculum sp.]
MADKYRYYPAQFPEPPVKVQNITLTLDFTEEKVTVTAETTFKAVRENLDRLKLNAKNLEIIHISQNGKKPLYTYENDIIDIKLIHTVQKGSVFKISTTTVCRPTSNILEGLYYETTPKDLTKTIISQCQQWGFQRIAPCIDDMRAKCTWNVTIIADKRYSNLITNGNIYRPRTRYNENRDTIVYKNSEPMPPYLFFVGVGTWDTFSQDFVYPNGKKVRLELLAPKNSDKKNAEAAIDIMADAILWTHIYTGAERYENITERNEIYRLCLERYSLMKNQSEGDVDPCAQITAEIEKITKDIVFGYQYPYEVYREIAMHNSDFGGMENTGNTTILASRIMPDAEITDAAYEYMLGVKQHEFYHNLNGSGVTGDTPFSIWLNEAVTVMMEDDYLAFHFGRDYIRLLEILQMRLPGVGTFSLDTGAVAMPIEPEGFNDPNDLITSVTYVKAPEFTRMIEFMLGKRAFAWALDLYHKRFAGSNASPRDWLHAMEDVGKADLSFMADRWLHQTGYPTVKTEAVYNTADETTEITVTQSGFEDKNPWIFPLAGKLYTKDGDVVSEFVKKIDAEKMKFSVPCSAPFDFSVWNSNHTAYIKINNDVSDEELYLQLRFDDDEATKFLARCELFEREMVKLCCDESYAPSNEFIDSYISVLSDFDEMRKCGVLPLTLFDSVEDERFKFEYTKLYSAKKRFMKAAALKYEGQLKSLLNSYDITSEKSDSVSEKASLFKARAVKNQILSLLAAIDTPEVRGILKSHYENAECATDRISALTLYLSSNAADRFDVLEAELSRSKDNALAFENFIGAAAVSSSPDTVSYLKRIEKSPEFKTENAGFSRAMYLRFAQNRKLSLETVEGRKFLEESLIKMSGVNEYLSTGILSVFSHIGSYSFEVRESLKQILEKLVSEISGAPSVVKTAETILNSLN